jgi:F0F1-type ATP synthase epsilon subunit
VLTPERSLLQETSVRKVRVKLADGAWLSVYPHHAPLIAGILPGTLYYEIDAIPERPDAGARVIDITVAGGLLKVNDNDVVILSHGAWLTRPADMEDVLQETAAGLDADGDTGETFDRLARQLMLSLGAGADGVLAQPETS